MLDRFHTAVVELAAAHLDLEPGQFHAMLLGHGQAAPHPAPPPGPGRP